MNSNPEKEIEFLEIQLITTILFIGSLIISCAITYNDIEDLKGKPSFFTEDEENKLAIFNRILVVGITFVFLYISYHNLQIRKVKEEDPGPFVLQLLASELSALAAVIVLYAVIKTAGTQYSLIVGGSNPNL